MAPNFHTERKTRGGGKLGRGLRIGRRGVRNGTRITLLGIQRERSGPFLDVNR